VPKENQVLLAQTAGRRKKFPARQYFLPDHFAVLYPLKAGLTLPEGNGTILE
jgi:hypothetical protein